MQTKGQLKLQQKKKKKKTGKNIHILEDKETAKKHKIKREICGTIVNAE